MKKAQSLIIQFVLFFMIGFSLFLAIGNLFKYQSEVFRDDILNQSIKLTSSYLSSVAINLIDTCKECDFSQVTLKIESKSAGSFFEITLDSFGLNLLAVPGGKFFFSTVHNLNSSVLFDGESHSAKPISLTFSRIENKLEVK